ncbi:MAG: radical SAM protein [Proteobacteria bacterium]|nr:radical SAM protein [Pseudomonadota bacterium]MBU1420243.1 radical SAM protein [Pseudomonadota bacterium]MBU1455572.1 radical SAM protein [Pseudomonadota bacterium]
MDEGTLTHSMILDIKLPVAPLVNHRLARDMEEKQATALVPAEAVAWLQALRKGGRVIERIELCGPGDVLASAPITLACLELLQPEIRGAELSLTTLGLGGGEIAADLARLGVKTVNMLVDTVAVETAMKLYTWIRPGKKTVPLAKAAEILIRGQAEAVQTLQAVGIRVVIRTTLVPGVNDDEISVLAEKMAGLGAAAMEISGDGIIGMEELCALVSKLLPTTVYHPAPNLPPPGMPHSCAEISMPKPTRERPNVAVVSTNGMDVDMHLGQASQVLIYGPREDGLACLLKARQTPDSGGGSSRWQTMAKECLHDCFALLASHAGDAPRKEFAELGIQVILTEDNIEGLVDVLYGGGKKKKCKK